MAFALCTVTVFALVAPLPSRVATSAQEPISVVVYFSRQPESHDDFGLVFPVIRHVVGPRVGTAALESLIAGPTDEERTDGYFGELGHMLDGPSFCNGADFQLAIVDEVATVHFCRSVTSAGVGQDARVRAQIEATLLQFPTVARVQLLDLDGHCLFDQSGMDLCFADEQQVPRVAAQRLASAATTGE
jgi:hypothetical protein